MVTDYNSLETIIKLHLPVHTRGSELKSDHWSALISHFIIFVLPCQKTRQEDWGGRKLQRIFSPVTSMGQHQHGASILNRKTLELSIHINTVVRDYGEKARERGWEGKIDQPWLIKWQRSGLILLLQPMNNSTMTEPSPHTHTHKHCHALKDDWVWPRKCWPCQRYPYAAIQWKCNNNGAVCILYANTAQWEHSPAGVILTGCIMSWYGNSYALERRRLQWGMDLAPSMPGTAPHSIQNLYRRRSCRLVPLSVQPSHLAATFRSEVQMPGPTPPGSGTATF